MHDRCELHKRETKKEKKGEKMLTGDELAGLGVSTDESLIDCRSSNSNSVSTDESLISLSLLEARACRSAKLPDLDPSKPSR